MRRLASLLAASLLLVLMAAPAAAQYDDEEQESVAVLGDTTVAPGEEVTITGEGFTPGATVSVSLDGAVLGTTTVAEDGTFTITVTIPLNAVCGDNTLDITSDEGDAASVAITIPCPTGAAGDADEVADGALAATGANVTVGMALVLGLFAAGGVALYATRKKDTIEA